MAKTAMQYVLALVEQMYNQAKTPEIESELNDIINIGKTNDAKTEQSSSPQLSKMCKWIPGRKAEGCEMCSS